ncbi:MAG: hypothetical protein QM656_11450 [Paracoccaceae bacterium]
MLSVYGSITVPDVPDVVVYRDDEDPRRFYMLSGKPRILRSDPRDPASPPILDLLAYVKDLGTLPPGGDPEVERGLLSMTVGLEISQSDQQKIRSYLRGLLAQEQVHGYRFLGILVRPGEPVLSYPPHFVAGTASATTFDETLQITAQGQSPAMGSGVNSASFGYQLTQAGARVIRQAMEAGGLPVLVRYEGLKFVARIPALTIRIHGDRREFLSQTRSRAVRRQFTLHAGIVVVRWVWYPPPTLSVFRDEYQSLKIEIDDGDFRDADPSDDLSKKLEEMAMTILQNNILPTFFERAIPTEEEGDDEKGKGYWLPDQQTTVEGKVDVTISRRDTVQITHAANGVLSGLSPDDTRAAIRLADANAPNIPFQWVTVVPNLNFAVDPIQSVVVQVVYDQMDEITGQRLRHVKEVAFLKDEGPVRFGFRLAQAADGTAKGEYGFRTRVTFRGSMATVEHPPGGGLTTRTGEYLVVSYAQMGQVKVDLVLAPMPPEVASVDVTLAYPDPGVQGAVQTISLSRDRPTASWLINVGSDGPPAPYTVTRLFRMGDGSALTLPPVQATGQVYTVTSPFEALTETTFVARGLGTQGVEAIFVTALYRDPAHDLLERETMVLDAGRRTAPWTVHQVDKDLTEFSYEVRVTHANGSDSVSTHTGTLGAVVPVGPSGSDAIEVVVDAGLADWARFARIMVMLEYSDPDNGVLLRKTMIFSETGPQTDTWTALIADPARRRFRYTVRRVGRAAADDQSEPPVDTDDPLVVLR